MSSSVGYYVSPVDLVAQRRRELRGEIAALRARLGTLRRRAAALGARAADRPKIRPRADSDVAELEAMVVDLHNAIKDATEQVDASWTRALTERIASTRSDSRSTVDSKVTRPAARQPGSQTTGDQQRQERVRQRAIGDVERLLRDAGPRCDPEDLSGLTVKFDSLSTLDNTDAVRSAALELAVGVREAVERRKIADQRDRDRATLIDLLQDAEPTDRDRLTEAVRSAEHPEQWRDQVHQAVERADLARHRRSVAAAAAAALAEAGCAVGEDFATLLVDSKEAVARLGPGSEDYGLLVRLPSEGNRLLTAMVRSSDAAADTQVDVKAQQEFCDNTLPGLVESLRGGGVELDPAPFLLTKPGERPLPKVPPDRLPGVRSASGPHRARRPAVRPVLKERRHGS